MLLVAFAGFGLAAPAAHATAPDCYTGGLHCYAIGDYHNGSGLTGAQTTIRREQMGINTSAAGPSTHLNSEFWFLLDNGQYLEAGARMGDDTSNSNVTDMGGCSCVAYELFWADHSTGGANDHEWRHTVSILPGNGDNSTIDFWQIVPRQASGTRSLI
jgi:hypothetical protein